MSTSNAQAGAISFAHLAGITTPIHAAKADTDEDKKDAKKAEDDSDDEVMESDDPEKDDDKKDDAKADADEPDEDDKPDDKKSKKASVSGVARGASQERARWVAVVGSRSFAKAPALGAHMLANTSMNASAILSVLRDAPATASASDGRSARNPNLGTSAPAVSASTTDRWGAAFKRAGIVK